MVSVKQKKAAKINIRKAQKSWKNMTSRQHSMAQPEGKNRAKPGSKGEGDYYRIEIRPKEEFVSFRYHDIGQNDGDLQRLAGRRQSGSWATQAWLISKKSAHAKGDILIADTKDARDLLATLATVPIKVKGDIFRARDRRNVPEKEKPTVSQREARSKNIKRAQDARWA